MALVRVGIFHVNRRFHSTQMLKYENDKEDCNLYVNTLFVIFLGCYLSVTFLGIMEHAMFETRVHCTVYNHICGFGKFLENYSKLL